MDPSGVRLPSFAEMASLADAEPSRHASNRSSDPAWHSVPDNVPISCSAPNSLPDPSLQRPFQSPAASPASKRNSWNAINRPDHMPASAASPSAPAGHSPHHQPNPLHHFSTRQPDLQDPSRHSGRHSPPRESQCNPAPKARPIRAPRQDSAVSESQPSLAPLPVEVLPTSPGLFSPHVPGSVDVHQPSAGWNAAAHPKTPPSPAPSPVHGPISAHSRPDDSRSQSTRHDRGSQELERDYRARQASAHSSSAHGPLGIHDSSPVSPHHIGSNHRPTGGSMAPPPHPFSTTAASMSISQASDESHARVTAPNPIQHESIVESNTSESRQCGSSSPPPQHYSSNHHYSTSLSDTVLSLNLGNPSSTRCLQCHDVWKYPNPDPNMLDQKQAATIDELAWSTDQFLTYLQQFAAKKAQDFAQWSRIHQASPEDPPCIAHDSMLDTSTGTKRRSDALSDSGQISTKLRKLSYNTPSPNISQLTPPPEPTSTSPSYKPATPANPERLHPYGSANQIFVNDRIATIVGLPNAPPPQFQRPANDASNMWYEPSKGHKNARPGR